MYIRFRVSPTDRFVNNQLFRLPCMTIDWRLSRPGCLMTDLLRRKRLLENQGVEIRR